MVHGDYRLGNVLIAPATPLRLTTILDWEMATLGDPLADVGYLTAMWGAPPNLFDLNPITRTPGLASAEELVERYAERSGRLVAGVGRYEVLALWKLAIIMEGNLRRARAGLGRDEFSAGFGDGVTQLAERAAASAAIPIAR